MRKEQHTNAAKEAQKQAWQALQGAPSYIERFREGRSSVEAEAHQLAQVFCGLCGFWVDRQHQCPPPQGA